MQENIIVSVHILRFINGIPFVHMLFVFYYKFKGICTKCSWGSHTPFTIPPAVLASCIIILQYPNHETDIDTP